MSRQRKGVVVKMKVLFITNIPAPYRVAFFNELGKSCELTVAFEGRNATDRDANWKGDTAKNFSEIYMRGKRVRADQFFCPEVISVIRAGYDAIILGGYTSPTAMLAMAYLRLRRIPFYMEADGGLIRKDTPAKYWLKKALISSADYWFSSGPRTTDYLVHYGAVRDRVFQYPFTSLWKSDILTAIPAKEERSKLRQELGISDENVVLAVGQFIHRKGYDVLLRAAAHLENIGIYIVGGEPTPEYLTLCQELKLSNVHFQGFQSKASLARYYQAADMLVLPTREDIWGLVVNEAMAYGLPVVTTDKCVAGLELVEDDVNGYIVPTEDSQALATAIERTVAMGARKMGEASLLRIQPYTIENMAQTHIDVLENNMR